MIQLDQQAAGQQLTDPQVAVLLNALDDEYHAQATYAAVIDRFGPERPFVNIIEAEKRHAAAIIRLLEACGVEYPANPYISGDKPLEALPATLAQCCEVGVAAEIENIRLYDEDLLPAVAGHAEASAILKRLRDASQDRHLPAFKRCASRNMLAASQNRKEH
jgi:hypothetical protein